MLEFGMPVHESWNIVHIAMQVPGSHQIYVAPDNCLRGVVMSAYEMDAGDRFSCVAVDERDLLTDSLETVTIEGCSEVIDELIAGGNKPSVIFLFTVCSHRMLSCDFTYVFDTIRERYSDIILAHGYMDCISQKEEAFPDQKLRREMYSFIPAKDPVRAVNLIGSEVTATAVNNDLLAIFSAADIPVRQLSGIRTFEGYMDLGNASLNICTYMAGDMGVSAFSERTGIPYLYALPFWDDRSLIDQLTRLKEVFPDQRLAVAVEGFLSDLDRASASMLAEYRRFAEEIKGVPVAVDNLGCSCPYSLAFYLLEAGFDVRWVISPGPMDHEMAIYQRLMDRYHIISIDPADPALRELSYRRSLIGESERILASGPRAAWIFDSPYFVDMIEDDGAFGIAGRRALLMKLREAMANPKDTAAIIRKKARGLISCIAQ